MLNVPHVPKKFLMQPCNLYVMEPIKLSFLSHPERNFYLKSENVNHRTPSGVC